MTTLQATEIGVGSFVRSLRDIMGVPKGSIGVVDEDYETGIMVAWWLPCERPPCFDAEKNRENHVLRDGFNKQRELEFLEFIPLRDSVRIRVDE